VLSLSKRAVPGALDSFALFCDNDVFGAGQTIGKRVYMNKVTQFVKESYAELRKVVWPSRDDVFGSVKVVIISTVVFALVLGLVDALLLLGVQAIF
jgi:preprotein translocase subunit SecE